MSRSRSLRPRTPGCVKSVAILKAAATFFVGELDPRSRRVLRNHAQRRSRGRVDLPGPVRAGLSDRRAHLPGLEDPPAVGQDTQRRPRCSGHRTGRLPVAMPTSGANSPPKASTDVARCWRVCAVKGSLPRRGAVDRGMRQLGLSGVTRTKRSVPPSPARTATGPVTCSTARSPRQHRTGSGSLNRTGFDGGLSYLTPARGLWSPCAA